MSVEGEENDDSANISVDREASPLDDSHREVNPNSEDDENDDPVGQLPISPDAAALNTSLSSSSFTPSIPGAFSAWNQAGLASPSFPVGSSQSSNNPNPKKKSAGGPDRL